MSFVFEGLLGGTITLAVIYLVLIIYVYSKLLWLQSNTPQGLNTRKLFVMSILLTCLLRFMSFASMTLLTLGSVHFQLESGGIKTDDNDDDGGDGTNKEFFAKASVVLFDFPDFCFVSAYVLLLIVWAETYLKSRRHWLSSVRFQQVWIWSYLIFNLVLYTTQTALYSLLFIPTIDEYVQTNLIYLTLAGFNLFLPICWIIVYLYMSILVRFHAISN
ncbi:DUF1084 domain-containing protein [archaeon]|nr:MAG: DUF1084 domain-containing protein [archaeon]